ncbi:NADH:flavin oxidoreductase [Lentisalinibacter salinarum]|uniref:NADH:flavin oxidoreductase n=1 Tax=Lentisalinibacter salinarum TaxID=2992239 RepID=UPI003869E6CF
MRDAFRPLTFASGARMKNRFALAPLTNMQSHEDGRLSDDEYRWLTLRAAGGFGLTMTCAAHVQAIGKGFPGQLGCFSDDHLEGLSRLADGIRAHDSLAVVQLHHAGMRSPAELIGTQPVCPSEDEETGARALTTAEVERLAEDFVAAAERAEKAGFDGVELHGAHGYILCQFLSPTVNRRTDRYGGSPENRARIILDIIRGIRDRCRPDFLLGIRLSPERFDLRLAEIRALAARLMREGRVDFIDLSLWDIAKEPEEDEFRGRSLLSYFTEFERGEVRLGAAGKLRTPADVRACLDAGTDFVLLGRAAILQHDFPERMRADAGFEPVRTPVSADYLRSEGLGDAFIAYMSRWKGFVG